MRPDAGVAVRLELDAHGAAGRAAPLLGLAEVAEEILRVVAVLVREDVRLGKRAALRIEAVAELLEEAEVDVDVLVGGTVERPDLGARLAAAGVGGTREEDGLGRLVVADRTLPEDLDAVDDTDDAAVLAVVGVGAGPTLLQVRRLDGLPVEVAERPRRPAATAAAQEEIEHEHDEPETASADGHPTAGEPAHPHAAAILDLGRVEARSGTEAHLAVRVRVVVRVAAAQGATLPVRHAFLLRSLRARVPGRRAVNRPL